MTSFSKKNNEVLMSPLQGQLKRGNKALAQVEVKQVVDESYESVTVTDDEGCFNFPVVTRKKPGGFEVEFTAAQELFYRNESGWIRFWGGVKREPTLNSEARGKDFSLSCNIDIQEESYMIGSSFYHTNCRWGVESDPPIDFDDMFDTEEPN